MTRISEENRLTQLHVREILQQTLDQISEALAKGGKVELRYFGVFEVVIRKPRVGRNPHNRFDFAHTLWDFSPCDLITVNSFRYACWRAISFEFPFIASINLGMGHDSTFLKKIQGSLNWV